VSFRRWNSLSTAKTDRPREKKSQRKRRRDWLDSKEVQKKRRREGDPQTKNTQKKDLRWLRRSIEHGKTEVAMTATHMRPNCFGLQHARSQKWGKYGIEKQKAKANPPTDEGNALYLLRKQREKRNIGRWEKITKVVVSAAFLSPSFLFFSLLSLKP
jgi:hypothetical protein